MDTDESIVSFLDAQILSIEYFKNNLKEINQICQKLILSRDEGKKIFAMGNGGSGSTASHFIADLLKTAILENKKRFNAIALTDNIPVMLAWSNDVSYDDVFVEQLKNYFSEGDVVIGFSGSGNSKNVIKALEFGKQNNGFCISFTGKSGGKLKNYSDICLKIPDDNMLTIESQHLTLCHCITNAIRHKGKPVFKYE